MRLRHIVGSEEKVKLSTYVVTEPHKYKSCWKSLFKNNNKIEVEIGCGKGNFLINKAIDNPNINYIGIEKYATVILFALKKIHNKNIPNLKFIIIDATSLDHIFYKEISKIYLNFSDPWPKSRHEKRRLSSSEFLKTYKSIFKSLKIIEMKTDNDELFKYSLFSFKKNGYFVIKKSTNYFGKYRTEYEDKFIENGKNINYVKVVKL